MISCNNKVHKIVWRGEEFKLSNSKESEQIALRNFESIVKCATNGKIQLIKAETDNWYWNTKKVVKEEEINY